MKVTCAEVLNPYSNFFVLVELWLQLLVISPLGEILFCGVARGLLAANIVNSHKFQNVTVDHHESNLYGVPKTQPCVPLPAVSTPLRALGFGFNVV